MRNYVFIKDETYSSTLYNNLTEYLCKDDDFYTPLIGQAPYKIKLMPADEAAGLVGNHPMMLTAKTNLQEPFNLPCDKIALVSFGGAIVRPSIASLMRMADDNNIGLMVSEATSNSEADLLYSSFYTTANDLKEKKTPHYCYMMMTKLQGTNVYYLVLNPTLVQSASHVELEGDCWIQHIKGIKDTYKDSIFTMDITPQLCAGHIVSGGLCVIDMLKDSIIQPEDREEFFLQLKLEINYREDAGSHLTSHSGMHGGTHISLAHTKDTPLVIGVQNQLLGDFINDKEKLRWEYIVTGL